LFYTVFGVVLAAGLYYFDYRKLEHYSKHIYLGTVFAFVVVLIIGQRFDGKSYLSLGGIYIDIVGIGPLLFSIALAGLFNKWDWNQPKKKRLSLPPRCGMPT
jgi:phosphoglycerol transferase MdoB-like AlkP superfamily enzyme